MNGLRVAGVSGVASPAYFGEPHPEPPYPVSRRKQATYYNQDDIDRALAVGRADILLLHNWPDLMNAARDSGWPSHWTQVGCEYLSLAVESLRPRWVFCGHMHHKAQHRVGATEISCISDFHRDPADAVAVLDIV